MVFTDAYHQPDEADPVLAPEVVLSLVRAHVASAREVRAVDETGGEARAYMVDEDLVLKTQRPHRRRERTSLAKEAAFLEHLAGAEPSIPVPRVLGYAATDDAEYLVMTRMPGTALSRAGLDGSGRAAALRGAGRIVRRIHSVDQAPLAASGLFPGDTTPQDLAARIRSPLARLLPGLATTEGWPSGLDPERVLEVAEATTPADADPRALHSNPGPEHVFVDPVTGAVTGLIDFGDAYRSHPAFDPRTWSSRSDSEALLTGYAEVEPVGEGFMAVWHLALIIQEATLATRGWRPVTEAGALIADAVQRLR